MGELYIPNETEIRGPWFIDSNDLEELDAVIEFINDKLRESKEKEYRAAAQLSVEKNIYADIDSAIAAAKKYDVDKYEKKVVITAKDNTRLIDDSIKGLLKDYKIKTLHVKDFHIHIQFDYSTKFELTITRKYDGELKYKIYCSDSDCKDEIRYKVDSWIDKHHPSKGNQIWNRFAFLFGMLSCFFMMFTVPFMISIESPNMQAQYKNQIDSLIRQGVTQENQSKSIELLLKYESGYVPTGAKEVVKINKLPIRLGTTFLLIFLLSIFYPKTTIGIGKHKSLLKFYKFYTVAVLVTLPATFILPIIVEWISNFIKG